MDTAIGAAFAALFLLCLLLVAISSSRNGYQGIPQVGLDWREYHMSDFFVWVGVWSLLLALIYCGVVDIALWAMKVDRANVSDTIHYYLQIYPFIGWMAAALVYHLLVDRPAPPWR